MIFTLALCKVISGYQTGLGFDIQRMTFPFVWNFQLNECLSAGDEARPLLGIAIQRIWGLQARLLCPPSSGKQDIQKKDIHLHSLLFPNLPAWGPSATWQIRGWRTFFYLSSLKEPNLNYHYCICPKHITAIANCQTLVSLYLLNKPQKSY